MRCARQGDRRSCFHLCGLHGRGAAHLCMHAVVRLVREEGHAEQRRVSKGGLCDAVHAAVAEEGGDRRVRERSHLRGGRGGAGGRLSGHQALPWHSVTCSCPHHPLDSCRRFPPPSSSPAGASLKGGWSLQQAPKDPRCHCQSRPLSPRQRWLCCRRTLPATPAYQQPSWRHRRAAADPPAPPGRPRGSGSGGWRPCPRAARGPGRAAALRGSPEPRRRRGRTGPPAQRRGGAGALAAGI